MENPLQEKELAFQSYDGTQLFYRAWLPAGQFDKAVVLFHRGHEHSGRMTELAHGLASEGFAYFAWDARGHGRSPGERGYATSLSQMIRDVDSFLNFLSAEYSIPTENISVLAHSVAAVVVGLWIHDYAPPIRAAILATPALQVKLYVPFALPALRFQQWWCQRQAKPTPYVKSYVTGKWLTHDEKEVQKYDTDPLISKQIAVNILLDLFLGAKRLIADAGAIRVPLLLISARVDWVVKNKPQRRFFERISSPFKKVIVCKDFYHAVFHETDRNQVVRGCRDFLQEVYGRPDEQTTEQRLLIEADKRGYTAEEYAWLSAGLPPISLKRLGYRLTSILMQTFGKMSQGIALGWQSGFDSGRSLDYVYENQPRGTGVVGEFFDKVYLESIGWRGIRTRKKHITLLLETIVEDLKRHQSEHSPIAIMDIAGGPGRYLLDFVKEHPSQQFDILIRDRNEAGLEQGRQLAQDMKLQHVRHEQADAFLLASYETITERKDIVLASGLFELFPENAPVLTALAGIARALKPGGYLLYTNQPWHPQLEFIAEVLLNREMKPWIMRRRSQAEMDALVRSTGFQKLGMLIDDHGIFSVSLARKMQ